MKKNSDLRRALLPVLLCFGTAAVHGQTFLLKWGTNGTGNGQFSQPHGIAVDASNNVYVVEGNSNASRVQKFNSSGVYQTSIGTPDPTFEGGNGKFVTGIGVAIDSAGNVYVSDSSLSKVEKFNSAGTWLAKVIPVVSGPSRNVDGGVFNPISHFAIDRSTDIIYFPDSGPSIAVYSNPDNGEQANPNRVQKYTTGGVFVLRWGGAGTGDGQFDVAMATAVDSSGNVYVTDRYNNRVQKFNSSGTFLAKWGSSGSGDGQFNDPRGIAVDSSGNVYVVDRSNHRIQKFTNAGAFAAKWGSSGSADGQFSSPEGVATDSAGNIYVTDFGNKRVQKFAPTVADTTGPTVASIVRQTPSAQSLAAGTSTATFRVTFSEAVNAPATSNFAVAAVNSSSIVGTIASVTALSTSIYDVAVTVASGTGEFRLKVVD